MKKVMTLLLISLLLLGMVNMVCAEDYSDEPYTFALSYQPPVIKGETKEAIVELIGVEGPLYTNALITIEVEGPGTATLLAIDTSDNEYDLAQTGTWGPPGGFPVMRNIYQCNTCESYI